MDNSIQTGIGKKVRQRLTGPYTAFTAACFIGGVALFYAWDLYAIYCGPIISSTRYEPVPHFSALVTSAAATGGFLLIALVLYRMRRFDTVGFAASCIAGVATLAGLLLAATGSMDSGLVQLAVDAVTRICSCWVIVSWGARYARLDSHTITVYALLSFLVASILCFLLMHSPFIVQAAFACLALPASMGLLLRVRTVPGCGAAEAQPGVRKETFAGLTWRIILVFFLFGLVTWTSILYVWADSAGSFAMDGLVIVGSGVVVAVLLVLAVVTQGSFSKSYIYKVVLPLIMSGTLLVAVFSFEMQMGPALIAIGYTCFDLFCFTLFADACRKTGTDARRAFGWCRAIEGSVPLASVALMGLLGAFAGTGDDLVVNLIGPASAFVVVAIVVLDRTNLFESARLNPAIDYPQAEVLYFARQCEKAIERCALSPREAEVLSLIVRGRSVPHIAQRLFISKSTVKTHITHIYAKLNVNDRQEMIDAIESIPLDEDRQGDAV